MKENNYSLKDAFQMVIARRGVYKKTKSFTALSITTHRNNLRKDVYPSIDLMRKFLSEVGCEMIQEERWKVK